MLTLLKQKLDVQNTEKFCYGNPESIEEIISTKEYIRDLQSTRDYISFIRDVLTDLDYSGFSDVLCNID